MEEKIANRKIDYFLVGIIVLALVLRLVGSNWGLPYLYQSEEYKTVNYALKMLGTKTLNPKFFEYPALYLYFMMVVYGIYFVIGYIFRIFHSPTDFAIYFMRNPTGIYLTSRIIEGLWGVGVVYLTYKIARKLFNRSVANLSALFVAITPNLIDNCHKVKGDMAMIFLSLLFFYCLISFYYSSDDGLRRRFYILSGITLGLSVATKYLAAGMGLLLPLVAYLDSRKQKQGFFHNYNFYLALILSFVFFFLGSPYNFLSYREFIITLKDISVPRVGNYPGFGRGYLDVLRHFLYIGDIAENYFWLGLAGYAGLVFAFYRWIFQKKEKYLLLIFPVLIYFFIVGRFFFPGKGFLFNAFPFFLILAAKIIEHLFNYSGFFGRGVSRLLLILSIFSSGLVSFQTSYGFTLPDPRTEAKNWIEKNIPAGTAILIDMPVKSPQLVMDTKQLEELYQLAVNLNSYKKEYFYYKMLAFKNYSPGYRIYQVKRNPLEVGAPPNLVEEAQAVQPLIDISSWQNVYRKNIRYIVVNSWDKNLPPDANEFLKKFYEEIPQKAKMIKKFSPKKPYQPAPEIYIYKL